MTEVNYCRREITVGESSRLCMNRITQANNLEWCNSCREHLPMWPANDPIPAVQSQEAA